MTYGQVVKGYSIPVFNERAIRAGAGITLLLGIAAFALALSGNRTFLKILVVVFAVEFLIRVIKPEYAPFNRLGGLLVINQKPEWSGAEQKRFAWAIGLVLATTMSILIHGFGITGIAPLSICLICLTFMWLESAVGYCAGCHIFKLIGKKPQACPGGVCSIGNK